MAPKAASGLCLVQCVRHSGFLLAINSPEFTVSEVSTALLKPDL